MYKFPCIKKWYVFPEYVAELLDSVFMEVYPDPSSFQKSWQSVRVPEAMCSSYFHPTKEVAVSEHVSRFVKSPSCHLQK